MIRTALPGELKTITDLAKNYWLASPHGQKYPFDWDSTLNFLRTCVIAPTSEICVYTYDNEPQGFGIAFLAPLCFSTGRRASIEFIYLQSPHSRPDNYAQMLGYFEHWASQNGASELAIGDYAPLPVPVDNAYTDQGYEYIGHFLIKRLNHND